MMALQPLNVLIVEDNLILSLFEEKLISRLGHNVVCKAKSGEEAYSLCKDKALDLILMDIFLEGDQDGFETASHIRQHLDVPIIFISGNSDLYRKKCDTLQGINDFIAKPFSKKDLKETIDRVIRQTETQTAV